MCRTKATAKWKFNKIIKVLDYIISILRFDDEIVYVHNDCVDIQV